MCHKKQINIYHQANIFAWKMNLFRTFCFEIFLDEKGWQRIFTYSVRIQENTDQKNSVFGHCEASMYFFVLFLFPVCSHNVLNYQPKLYMKTGSLANNIFFCAVTYKSYWEKKYSMKRWGKIVILHNSSQFFEY